MRWTPEEYDAYQARRAESRPRPVVQKRQDAGPGKTDNAPKETEVDGQGRSFYSVSITLLVSDNRDRDGDGAISTLLDTYLFAIGGLLGLDRSALRKLAKSEERRRGSRNNH